MACEQGEARENESARHEKAHSLSSLRNCEIPSSPPPPSIRATIFSAFHNFLVPSCSTSKGKVRTAHSLEQSQR